ncbi:hypothetical protein L210DRAFT_3442116 [Boletus edulis BED1]|uniref:non-specific serine/threonine protein kinase n=1 Tax=Boletus edulis BED1 TaxID=1328754 RepID=A0AAD4GJ74_BOLED|nr:hypothetical protein L210DRAFT_3442116 [Boletus edulis BED1]
MHQQAYPTENKGTLLPGQTISVNKYTVQVDRYLSQGGFSHVYLVRTATPVYNTTHHVLKRIAVPTEALLTEVKKEVDIMRILKGHPNIVYLIDAAWHRMSNGQYEVFILMEFCPGGGIIDMMNRRLRERLTEAEILQIFVDVLEGVAAMHNLRPALLHRDLKVENILHSSSTSFKLCDFGSATPVAARPPSTTQEIRALEAELNRHTTLQYRPPEMIDPYLRRPVDEKSDVWALGVLLYKLCYYTTPFEEHGPLAILNVQFRIPPYPVYSPQLNGLIVSMLREHGTQRPSVFELLAQVHRIRGTESRFTYHIVPQQPLSPRVLDSLSATPLDNLVSYRTSPSATAQRPLPAKNTGIQARDKVLEAIAPMRRGRPSSSQQQDLAPEVSKPSTPRRIPLEKPPKADLLDDHFGVEEDSAWRAMKSSAASSGDISNNAVMSAWRPKGAALAELDATWSVESLTSKVTDSDARSSGTTFGDNFAEGLWKTYDNNRPGSSTTPLEKAVLSKIALPPEGSRTTKLIITKGKDAFEGLGVTSSTQPAPTLGEARKLRTGLAAVNAYNRPTASHSPPSTATKPKPTTAGIKPTPSPRPPLLHASRITPGIQTMSNSISSPTPASLHTGELSAQARFPSLEELDATMVYSHKSTRHTTQPEPNLVKQNIIDLSLPSTSSIPIRPQPRHSVPSSTVVQSSTRSEPVIARTPVREAEKTSRPAAGLESGESISPVKRPSGRPPSRSSLSTKRAATASPKPLETRDLLDLTGDSSGVLLGRQKTREYKDWLTGDVDTLASPTKDRGLSDTNYPETPVLREFTHKRSSLVEVNNVHIRSPQEAITGHQSPEHFVRASTPPSPTRRKPRSSRSKERKQSTSLTSSHKNTPLPGRPPPASLTRSRNISQDSATGSATRPPFERSSSSDDWRTRPTLESPREGKMMSSSDEEHPEDAIGFRPSKSAEKVPRTRHKGRQSSVHDLVDLWGGGVVQTREWRKDALQNPSTDSLNEPVTNPGPTKSRSIAIPSVAKFSASSPQHLQVAPSGAIEVPRSPSRSPNRRSPNSHRKQVSAVNSTSGTPTAASRGRPQSLLVFPISKSTSDGKLDTPMTPSGLSVPQDGSRLGRPRRPSITDMVQRYEAIGKVASPGSLPLPKSAATPGVTPTTTGRALQLSLHSPMSSKYSPSRVPLTSDDISPAVNTEKRQLLANPKPSFTGPTEKRTDLSRSQSSVSGLPTTSSSKLLSHDSSQGGVDGLPYATTLAAKANTPEEDPRPPSPEKPYQGVGKLIDQWQRKSEESSRSPVPRRVFTTKRAGLVGGGVSRDN